MDHSFPIVGIGASAGGLEACLQLLKHLPADTGMGFVLVQHLDPEHESALSHLLARATTMPVHEVIDRLRVEPNQIYVIPPGKQMVIANGVLRLQPRVRDRRPQHAIDHFMESLAHDRRERAIGVILSGTATDGTLGLEAIKGEGGITFAQDKSAKYDSMPRSAVAAGCVDFELAPRAMAKELDRVARHPHVTSAVPAGRAEADQAAATAHEEDDTPLPSGGSGSPETGARQAQAEAASGRTRGAADTGFKKILRLVRNHAGVDFSLYKSATIRRRITRRLVLARLETIEAYADSLQGNAHELDALYSDMLISVTSFFRNQEAFALLQRKVFPKLLAERSDLPVRIWVLGCSTGQEAYSLAMAYAESASRLTDARRLQIFATDLNEALLEKARAGLYAKSLAQDLSPERLRRFFVEEEGGYRANKQLRETVVFARQNVLSDPPFSRMDLISCRNLLIYIEPDLQKRILPMFHYALNPHATLFLGASESVGGFTDLFEPLDKKQKIFIRKSTATPSRHLPMIPPPHPADRKIVTARAAAPHAALPTEFTAQREADRLMVNQFAPPGVLINAELQILQFRGATSAYLTPPTGRASFDLLKMAREELLLPLRDAIKRAKKEGKPVRKSQVRVRQNGRSRLISLQVIPLKNLKERSFLVLFEEAPSPAGLRRALPLPPPDAKGPGARKAASRRTHALEAELAEARDYVQSLQEQHEAAHEEMQASHEEVTSANEELQSLNEELETSKEELESTNEELTTVNEEMGHRNQELNRLNADLNNLHLSINTVILVLNRDLTIRRYTAAAEKTLNLLPTDVGRPLGSVRHNLEIFPAAGPGTASPAPVSLEACVREVIDTLRVWECEARDRDDRWYMLRVRPYLTIDNKVDGAVLVLTSTDALKRGEAAIRVTRDYAEAILRTSRTPLLVLRADLSVNSANAAFYRVFKTEPAATEGKPLERLGNGEWDIPRLRQWLLEVLPRNSFFDDFEVTQEFTALGRRSMLLNARQIEGAGGGNGLILLGIEDVTERQRLDAAIRHSEERFRALTLTSAQIIWTAGPDGRMRNADSALWKTFTGQAYADRQGAIHPDDRAAAEKLWADSVASGQPYRNEYRLRRADGVYRWMAVHAVPVPNPDGSVREWVGMNADISGRKEAEAALRESEERYRTLFSSMDEGYCVIEMLFDPDGRPSDYRFLEVNTAFEKQSGMHDVTGKRMLEFVANIEEHWLANYGQVALTGESIRFANEYKSLGRWFDVYAFRLGGPDSRKVAVLFTDITGHRKSTRELQQARDEAVAASRAKDRFIATLSHELRTPLNPVLLLASYNANNESLPREVRDDFETINNNINLEARLIDDLLDLTRITSGKLRMDTVVCDVHALLRDAIAIVRADVDAKRLRLSVNLTDGYACVRGDPTRLQQVFWNILRNAIHFTPADGAIVVTTGAGSKAETLVVTITDTGVGILAGELERIFDAFAQSEARPGAPRPAGGLGLGLAISRKMVELHAGTIHAASPGPGQGATFVIELPLLPEAERGCPVGR